MKRKFRLDNGQYINVPEDKLDMFMQENPNAVEVGMDGTIAGGVYGHMGPLDGIKPGSGKAFLKEKKEDVGAWQNLKNNVANTFETVYDVAEYWGVAPETWVDYHAGQQSTIGITKTILLESMLGKERLEYFGEKYGLNKYNDEVLTTESELFAKAIQAFEEEREQTRPTLGFRDIDSIGDFLSVTSGAVLNVAGSVAFNLGTGFTGYFMDFGAENFITANKAKAEAMGVSLDELILSGKHDTATPLKVAGLQAGLELIPIGRLLKSFGGKEVTKAVGREVARKAVKPVVQKAATEKVKKEVKTATVKKVGEKLTKEATEGVNNNVKIGLNILGNGLQEGGTEMVQHGLGVYNEKVATDEDTNFLLTVFGKEGAFSSDGIESGLQGLVGGMGVSGIGTAYSSKTLQNIRSSSNELDVSNKLENLVNLRRKLNATTDPDVRDALKEKITDVQYSLNKAIRRGNNVYNSLSEKDIGDIETLGDLKESAAYRMKELDKKLKNNKISQSDYDLALESLSKKYKNAENRIKSIINTEIVQKNVDELNKLTGLDSQVNTIDATEIAEKQLESISEVEAEIAANQEVLNNVDPNSEQGKIAKNNIDFFNSELDGLKNADTEFGFIKQNPDGSFDVFLNKNKPMAGTAVHEFLHAVLFKTLWQDSVLQDKVGGALTELMNQKGIVSDAFIKRMSAYIDPLTGKRASNFGEETITVLSESMIDGSLEYNENFVTKIGDALRRFFQENFGMEVRFDTGQDVFNFIKDFNHSIKKGKVSKAVMKVATEGVKGKLVEGRAVPGVGTQFSKDADQKTELDKFVEKGYDTKEDFRASDDYFAAYNTIVESNLLDGIIVKQAQKEGLTDMPQGFVRDVKERVGEKFLSEFDPAKNESLFGWMTGPTKAGRNIIQLAAGDVVAKRTEKPTTTPMDVTDKEGKPVVKDIAAEEDVSMKELEEKDILKEQLAERKRKKEGKPEKKEGPPKYAELAGYSKSEVSTINKTASTADIQLKDPKSGRVVQYKDFKKLLVPSKVGQTSPLLNILETVAKRYNIPVDRIIKNQDLTTDMRKAAQTYIKDNVSDIKKNILPFGQTASGKATGAANTKLGVFYKKGLRVKAGEGRGTQGKAAQDIQVQNLSDVDFLKEFGINEDGTLVNNKKFDGILRALLVQESVLVANQAVRVDAINKAKYPAEVIALVGDGRSATMFSKDSKLNEQKIEAVGLAGTLDAALPTQELKNEFWHRMPLLAEQALYSLAESTSENIKALKQNAEIALLNTFADIPAISKIIASPGNKLVTKFQQAIQSASPKLKGKTIPTKAKNLAQSLLSQNIRAENKTAAFTNVKIPNTEAFKHVKGKYVNQDLINNIKSTDHNYVKDKVWNPQNPAKSLRKIALMQQHSTTSPSRAQAWASYDADGNPNHVRNYWEKILNSQYDPKTGRYHSYLDVDSQGNPVSQMSYTTDVRGRPNNIIYKGKPLKVNLTFAPQKSKDGVKDVQDKKAKAKRDADSELAAETLNEYVEYYSDSYNKGLITNVEINMIMGSLLSNMSTMLARAAKLKYVAPEFFKMNPKNITGENSEFEHMHPRVGTIINMFAEYIDGDGISDIKEFLKNNVIQIINKDFNKALQDAGLGDSLHEGQTAEDSPLIRNYNSKTITDPRITSLLDVDTSNNPANMTEVSPAKEFKKFQTMFVKDVAGNTTLARAHQFSKSAKNPKKGASFWDFDDTLATTKSGVRAKIPNPDGTPKPGRKVIFLAGGAGSGKSSVVKKLGLEKQGYKLVNSDISLEWLKKNHGLPADMSDYTREQLSMLGKLQGESRRIAKRKKAKYQGNGDGVIIDGTGASANVMRKQVAEFKDKGYDVGMVFVETSEQVSVDRNKARKERSLREDIVRKNHKAVMANKETYSEMFGENFGLVNTDNLRLEDPMPADLVNKMDNFTSSYENRRLDAEEFANEGADIIERGGTFDFAEFDQVVEGEKGPLFGKAKDRVKKYGDKDNYVITARPHAAKAPIFEFLKSQGLNIPLENVITLQDSTPEAKALVIADKVADGYNDIYFADDALQNVQQVKNVLDQFDIKSVVQQAKATQFSKINKEFNNILEGTTGVEAKKIFSEAIAKKRGAKKGRFEFFIPPSAEDFKGLLYYFLGKGKQGEKDLEFFKENLLDPLNNAYVSLNRAKQAIANDFNALKKQFPGIRKKLASKIPGQDFTYGDAVRVSLWDRFDFDIPGLSKSAQQSLSAIVKKDKKLLAFSDMLSVISKQDDGYVRPGEFWIQEDIRNDLANATDGIGRKQFFTEFIENSEEMFSPENMNKIEAIYGENFREAMDDMLYRIKNGTNRSFGSNKMVNQFMNWINGSIGATMFFNMRSAVLQTLSTVNFINWGDNNPLMAAKAFSNQKQFWSDFSMIFNSDLLKQRRSGLRQDVNAAELTNYVSKSKQPMRAAVNWLLQKGFLPTQMMDSFAIAMGGSSMYRNRINTYIKQGMSKAEAEAQAFQDFQEIAEETQQSARPDKISQQQASPLGRLILAFQNTPMQYMRLMKKAMSDLANGRGDAKTNVSKIIYYGAVQNLIFYSLQSAIFAMMFGDDDDENEEFFKKKKHRVANSMVDGILRGIGVAGAVVATVKNMVIKFAEQEGKTQYQKDESALLVEMLNLSPPIGIKARKIIGAQKSYNYNKKVSENMDLLDINNPTWQSVTGVIEATTNVPLARLLNKTMNVRAALDQRNATWQRIAMFMGWNRWDVGVKNQDIEKIKEDIRKQNTYNKKKKKEPKSTIKIKGPK